MINLQQTNIYIFYHTFNVSIHYIVKYECQKNGSNLKYIGYIVINDKSQGSVAKHLSWDGLFHYKFITQFAGEKIAKLANIWRRYRQNG